MNTSHIPEDYVKTALLLQGMTIDDEQLAAVTQQFILLTAMAYCFLAEPLPHELEPATVYQL